MRDIIELNNLKPPYILKVGDVLKLPVQKFHRVVSGDNLYNISRNYGMSMNQLIRINNLKEPYTIKPGDKIQIVSYIQSSGSKSNNSSSSTFKKKIELPNFRRNNKFIWPVKGRVISSFGPKPRGLYNDGINIQAKFGTSVKVAESGVVAYVGNELRGYGNLIIVKHSKNWISAYAHLSKTLVKRGDKVNKGNIIAKVGSTGNVSSSQLYFGVRKGRDAVNPILYLKYN